MLVISLCWWLYDGDWFEILVAESLYWWLISLCWWFSLCIKSVTNILNRSPTSQTCHQNIWSPTSMSPMRGLTYSVAANSWSERPHSPLTATLSVCEIATTKMNTFLMNLNSEIKGSLINGEEFLLFLKADVGVQGQWKSGQLCFVHFSDEHTDNGQNPDNKQTPVRRRLIICILYVPSYSDMIWIFYHIRRIQNWNALHELFSFVFLDFLYKILKNVINPKYRKIFWMSFPEFAHKS